MNEQTPVVKKSIGAQPSVLRRQTPIAVVGMAALFPGSAQIEGFWRNIVAGRDLIADVPPGHWSIADYFDPDPRQRGKTYGKRGGFLPKIPFDPMEHGIPPTSLPATDTAQLLALIVARQVLEDALGTDFATISLERASVILGVTSATELVASMASSLQRPVWTRALREAGIPEVQIAAICDRIEGSYSDWTEATFPGLLGNVVAGRIANRFNFGGTNCVVDAACASSLAAVNMAIQELESGATDLAITGGVDAINDVFMFMCFSKTPALSQSGECRPFSVDADGTLLGEGLGMMALRRLDDAERDGNHIYAVLRGLGGSSDGRAKSVYAPRAEGQARALRRAYEAAGYGPDTVELVEAHGTGTVAGDATEIAALRKVFDETRSSAHSKDQPWCAIGSVKSQIGHTKSAAGAAALYKTVMALHHQLLPPTIKVTKPIAALEEAESPFYVNTAARPWIRGTDHPRRAAVSSFGFGGSNFHITLEEYTGPGLHPPRTRLGMAELFLFSGADPAAAIHAARYAVAAPDGDAFEWLARRSQREFRADDPARLAIVADRFEDLVRRIDQAAQSADGKTAATAVGVHWGLGPKDAGKIAFFFPGQGSQYLEMGGDLAMAFPRSRNIWDRVAARTDCANLHHIVFPPPRDGEAKKAQIATLTDTRNAQPALAVTSVLYLDLIRAAGVDADAAAGHSFGEIAALHWAGAFDDEELLAIARARGAAMADAASLGPGAMTAVRATAEEIAPVLAAVGEGIVLANRNAARQVVIAGAAADIVRAETLLSERGLGFKRLNVSTAFHTPMMQPAVAAFGAALATTRLHEPARPVFANVTAAPYDRDAGSVRTLMAEQLTSPVRFAETVDALYALGTRLFIEVGPGSVLTGLVEQCLEGRAHRAVALDGRGPTVMVRFLDGLGRLAAAGVPLDLSFLWDGYREKPVRELVVKPGSVMIDGTNYGKPFPPAEGTRAAPLRPAVAAPEPMPMPRDDQERVMPPAESSRSVPPPSSAPVIAAPSSAVQTEVLATFERIHAQAAEAHRATQQAMADAHLAYLRTTEATLARLQGLLGGTAATPEPTFAPAAPVRAFVVPATVSIPPTPIPLPTPIPAPPVVWAMPVPVPASAPAMASALGATPREVQPQATVSAQNATATLIAVVAEKTGYPANMLTLDMELEADLGIDSIKRVEILSDLQKRHPALADLDTRELSILPTLRAIIDYVEASNGTAVQKKTPHDGGAISAAIDGTGSRRLLRLVQWLEARSTPGTPLPQLGSGATVTVVSVGRDRGVAAALSQIFSKHDATVLDGPDAVKQSHMVVLLCDLQSEDDNANATAITGEAIQVARRFTTGGTGGRAFVVVQGCGGRFALDGTMTQAWHGCFAGLARTAATEWPDTAVRLLDVACGAAEDVAARIFRELLEGADTKEIGLPDDGSRLTLVEGPRALAESTSRANLPEDPVLLVTGGARGVTAACIIALARSMRCRLALVRRGGPVDDPPELRSLITERALVGVLARLNQTQGVAATPAALASRARAILAAREAAATVAAIEAAGSQALLISADVADAAQNWRAVAEARRVYGRIDGIIHGAGVLADRTIADKTENQSRLVLDTKITGLRHLLDATEQDALRLIILFSSVAGRYGNPGQVDYAMANAGLAGIARREAARRGGACLVRSIDWGAWDGGMVGDDLRAMFARQGVPLIGLHDGAQAFVAEIRSGRSGIDDAHIALVPDRGDTALARGSTAPGAAERSRLQSMAAPD